MLSSDTYVFILSLYHWTELKSEDLEELWVKAGTGDSSRYVPIHDLALQIMESFCQVLPVVHTFTGCDYSSKFGTKLMTLKASSKKYLMEFGAMNNIDQQLSLTEEYLVKVLKKARTCTTTDQLRCHLYHHSKRQCFEGLPPTSYATKLHIQMAFYATYKMTNVLSKTQNVSLDPCLYGFEIVAELLVPQVGKNPIPEDFTVKCNCLKCATERCPCCNKNTSSCSFCKCRSGLSGCKYPYD